MAEAGDSQDPPGTADGGSQIESQTEAMLEAFGEDDEEEPQNPEPPAATAAEETSAQAAEAEVSQNTAAMLQQFGQDSVEQPEEEQSTSQGHRDSLQAMSTGKNSKDASNSGSKDNAKDDRLIKVKGLNKQQLCIDLLMVGCVQSFVDFFYITHRKSAAGETNAAENDTEDVEIHEDTLIFLKETLETAEQARRYKNYQHCFESYSSLAEYFEKVPDLRSAMYFYQRCADVAAEVDARESIAKANLNLGTCEEQACNWKNAMQYHEKALQIAESSDSLPLQIKAASRLTHVYQVLAEQCEKENRDADATQLYERCLSCAQLSKDAALEGTACHKLGLSKHKTGHYERAIELQTHYLEICRMHDDRVGESAARAALAQAFEAIDQSQEAIKQLENLLNVASEAGELKAQASACLNLGILYSGRGDHEKSVELLEQHFDLARQIGDRRLIDSARVVLGMVRGNGKLKGYINLVNNDLEALLKWKSKRSALDS